MRIVALLLLAALPAAVLPGAAAATVVVPSQVTGDTVAFRVDDAIDGNATFTMGSSTAGPKALPDDGFHVFDGRAPGIHTWSVMIENATHTTYHNGSVLVQADPMEAATATLDDIATRLAALTALLDPSNNTGNGTVWSQLNDNWNATVWGHLQNDLTWLRQSMGTHAETGQASDRAGPVAATGATVAAVSAVAALVLVALLQWQARRHYQEQMVLMLAVAAQLKVGPDSPEFQRAVTAFKE